MSDSNPSHRIKVPIFSSEIKERTEGGLFQFDTYNALIEYIRGKIDKFNTSKEVITQSKSSKVKELQISKIEYFKSEFEKVPTLLLKITAYNTNLLDGFVEIDEKKELKNTDKVGSDTNFMLIYPCISGALIDKFSYQFKFFVYDDPTKDSHEIISICKLVSNKILDIKVRNLKLDTILKELHEEKILENVEIHLSSQFEESDDPDIKMKNYLVKSKVSKITKNNYKNIPSDKFENLLNQTTGSFIRRTFKLHKNKREIKIIQEYKNDLNKLSNTIEEIFNSQYELNQVDLKNLFEKEFVLKNLEMALRDFYKQNQ